MPLVGTLLDAPVVEFFPKSTTTTKARRDAAVHAIEFSHSRAPLDASENVFTCKDAELRAHRHALRSGGADDRKINFLPSLNNQDHSRVLANGCST
jgi:hypothetical protein